MPLNLEPLDVTADLEGFRSVLIVSCPICPTVSLAIKKNKPVIEFFKHGFKTEAFEDYIKSIRAPLEQRGIRTGVYRPFVPSPLMCVWTDGQRKRLRKRAKDYEAVLVLGCDSATYTAKDSLKDTDCKVLPAMRLTAITNATMRFRFPMTVELDMHPMPKKRRGRRHQDSVGAAKETERVAP